MDLVGTYIEVLKPLWWFLPVLAILWFLGSPSGKGFVGDLSVRLAARFQLDRAAYHTLHNVTLPTKDGTTQIDHVIVSRYGIFVIETKNMKGWIFGRADDAQWTQSIYGNNRRFQNPLRQNFKHVKALEEALQVPAETLHSVIAFVGDARLKSDMPKNVTTGGGFIAHLKTFGEAVFTEAEVASLLERLRAGRLAPTLVTHRAHVERLKRRDDESVEQLCPRCGGALVRRTVARGERAGETFWGCSGYPRCRYTR